MLSRQLGHVCPTYADSRAVLGRIMYDAVEYVRTRNTRERTTGLHPGPYGSRRLKLEVLSQPIANNSCSGFTPLLEVV
jgi:hypothetical protein